MTATIQGRFPLSPLRRHAPARRADASLRRGRWPCPHPRHTARLQRTRGILRDEDVPQDQDDRVEAIAWLASQHWFSGAIGQIGISCGGFNALQVAARQLSVRDGQRLLEQRRVGGKKS